MFSIIPVSCFTTFTVSVVLRILIFSPPCLLFSSRGPDESGPVYSIEQPEEREPNEPSGKKLDKELKQGAVKADMAEPLSQYELGSYPSESTCIFPLVQIGESVTGR